MAKRDYYEVLGVSTSADVQEIKKAYRGLAVQFHPDRNPGNGAAADRFREAAEAYSVLADPDKRKRYDMLGPAAFEYARDGLGFDPSIFKDFSDIFGDIFESPAFFNQVIDKAGLRVERGQDLRFSMEIDFGEAVAGLRAPIKITRLDPCGRCEATGVEPGQKAVRCPRCKGKGRIHHSYGKFNMETNCRDCGGRGEVRRVRCSQCKGQGRYRGRADLSFTIPAGMESGARFRLRSQGDAGPRGGPRGDLYVVVMVKADPRFKRDGGDLYGEVHINFAEATLGAVKSVPCMGGKLDIRIPPGTQSGTTFQLKGKGVAGPNGTRNGDYFVTAVVETPTNLDADHLGLFQRLSQLQSATPLLPKKDRRSFFRHIFG